MSSMTSPSPSPPHQQANMSRRPPRKSTLTQQQKNQKRQRATQEQLVTLEAEFNKNPTPTAIVRERIAQEINMTERSVQIWFQNRRAKIKHLAKKSFESGEECEGVPDCVRQYWAMQAMESGKAFPRGLIGDRSRSLSAYGSGNTFPPEQSPAGKIVIHHFTCRSLSIGSWRRVGQTMMDLVVFYSPEKACITYYFNNSNKAGYKIEYPFAYIESIDIKGLDSPVAPHGGQKYGQLVITLNQAPYFFMDSSASDTKSAGFYQCGDFTEEQQASRVLVHHLDGHPKVLQGQLAKLMTLDAFANRHAHVQSHLQLYDNPSFSVSAPVSPHIVRPASSNDAGPHLAYPQEQALGHNFHLKHRRTRSRSVPIPVDYTQLQQNMPSFSFQDAQDHLYAPAPQHTHALIHPGISNPLRIDTSSSGFLDYRPGSAYPLSAATTTSPSDYASPSMINSSLQHDMSNNASYGTPYSLPFLSPLVDPTSIGASVSPISMGPGDPVIASTSPPMCHLQSANSELFPESYDEQNSLSDDSVGLSELYSKQSLALLGHSPSIDDRDGVDMHQLMHFSLASGVSPDENGI